MNGNVDKSTAMYEELIESNPDQSEYLENYICLLLAQDKKDEAKTQFDILAEKYPASKKIEELSKQFETPPEEELEPALEESVN